MTLTNALMIVAVLLSPFLAVFAQRWIDLWREQRERKHRVFKTLMATRATPVSIEHVQALNMIELEFTGKSEESVRAVWREYRDHLNSFPRDGDDQKERLVVWSQRTGDLLAALLDGMGRSLGYRFDSVQIKKGAYFPEAHGTAEMEGQILRRTLLEWLVGDRHVSVSVVPVDEDAREEGKRVIERILAVIGNDGRIKVDLTPSQPIRVDVPPDNGGSTGTRSS